MNVTYTPELRAYMQRKGKPHVVVDTCSAKTCGGPIAELNLSLATDEQAEDLRPGARAVHAAELGDVLIMARDLEVSEDVTFGLRTFLGIRDVTAEGIAAFRF